jgi:hypothetical protein
VSADRTNPRRRQVSYCRQARIAGAPDRRRRVGGPPLVGPHASLGSQAPESLKTLTYAFVSLHDARLGRCSKHRGMYDRARDHLRQARDLASRELDGSPSGPGTCSKRPAALTLMSDWCH